MKEIKDIIEVLNKIPGLFEAFGGGIGWFGNKLYNKWEKSRLPYKNDKKRYDYIIENVATGTLDYFNHTDFSRIPREKIQSLNDIEYSLNPIPSSYPSFVNKTLKEKEALIFDEINKFIDSISKLHWTDNSATFFTIYCREFDGSNREDCLRADEIKHNLDVRITELVNAYEDFRDFGNKMFSERL